MRRRKFKKRSFGKRRIKKSKGKRVKKYYSGSRGGIRL